MVSFLDGPAAGVVLELHRAPVFLRVVIGHEGVDALDQLDDEPRAGEDIAVYQRVGNAGSVHLSGRDKNGRRFGRTLATAEYRLHAEQPADEIVRSQVKWRNWCEIEWDRLKAQQTEANHV